MTTEKMQNIAVLYGGLSREREVSLVSGRKCSEALERAGFEADLIDAGRDLPLELQRNKPDAVFNALHGRWGEDGCVQGLLEILQIPYTHSGVCASSVAMNKELSKSVFAAHGLRTPKGRVIDAGELDKQHPAPPPYVVKPINEGSSVGVQIVRAGQSKLPRAMPEYGRWVMLETFVPGRELTVSVLQGRAITVTEIVTGDWYDYSAKYDAGGSKHILPAAIPSEIFRACLEQAETAHAALGCRGLTRTDFRWDEEKGAEGLHILELNTQPGMTPTSLSPEQAAFAGVSFKELCSILVSDASCDR